MLRLVSLVLACSLLAGCTVADFGLCRDKNPADWDFGSFGGYAECAWPANDKFLTADLLGGGDSGTLVSVDLWRLLHLEIGLLGLGIGIGPLQIGGGVGFYRPAAPPAIPGSNPFDWSASATK